MEHKLQRPSNPYDPLWVEYARQNPGLRRSLSAADAGDSGGGDGGSEPIDFSNVLPDSYKGDDGAWNTDGFRADYDALVSFKAQADERTAEIPETADAYKWALGEDHQFPEGFDAKDFATKDADGKDVDFDPNAMLDAEDASVKALQELMHQVHKGEVSPVAAMSKMAGMMINRDIKAMMDLKAEAADQTKALGPEGQSRIDTVDRSLKAMLPEKEAAAVADSITSADALRGMEKLLQKQGGANKPPAGKGVDYASMTPRQRLQAGLAARKQA